MYKYKYKYMCRRDVNRTDFMLSTRGREAI